MKMVAAPHGQVCEQPKGGHSEFLVPIQPWVSSADLGKFRAIAEKNISITFAVFHNIFMCWLMAFGFAPGWRKRCYLSDGSTLTQDRIPIDFCYQFHSFFRSGLL